MMIRANETENMANRGGKTAVYLLTDYKSVVKVKCSKRAIYAYSSVHENVAAYSWIRGIFLIINDFSI